MHRCTAVGSGAELDGIVNGKGLDDGPDEACGLDFAFTPEDFLGRPRLATIKM